MFTFVLLLALAGFLVRLVLQWVGARTRGNHHRNTLGAGWCPRGADGTAQVSETLRVPLKCHKYVATFR